MVPSSNDLVALRASQARSTPSLFKAQLRAKEAVHALSNPSRSNSSVGARVAIKLTLARMLLGRCYRHDRWQGLSRVQVPDLSRQVFYSSPSISNLKLAAPLEGSPAQTRSRLEVFCWLYCCSGGCWGGLFKKNGLLCPDELPWLSRMADWSREC